MLNLRHVDPVVCLVCPDPSYPDDAFLEVHRYDKAIVIALDLEDDPLGADDACRRIEPLHISGAFPDRLADFVVPLSRKREA